MANIPQIPKLTPDKDMATWAAQVVDTLNPVLRSVLLAGGYRWSEVAGVNGAAPTFALQVAQRGGTWATVASFDSTGQIVQPAWIAPTLLNGWVNFDAVNNSIAGYLKDSLGFIHLRGTVKAGVVGIGTSVFVLPAGFRPSKGVNFPVVSNGAFGYVFIDNAGRVQVVAGSNVYVDLDGIAPFDGRR